MATSRTTNIEIGETYDIKIGCNWCPGIIRAKYDGGGWEAVMCSTGKRLAVKNPDRIRTRTGGPGRPAGTPSQQAAPLSAERPRCHVCDSTNLKVLRVVQDMEYNGTRIDGQRYTRIIRRRMKCGHCGRVHIAKSWEFDPEKWAENDGKESANPR